jgi:hypothetical protein
MVQATESHNTEQHTFVKKVHDIRYQVKDVFEPTADPATQHFYAGVLPAYWPMRAFWSAVAGEDYVGYLGIGAMVAAVALALAAWLFDERLLRRA